MTASMNAYRALRPLIFKLDPEDAHHLVIAMLRLGSLRPFRPLLRALFRAPAHPAPVEVCGLSFPNPIGIAAGFDKDGLAHPALACLGFGHIEVGTVTPCPQPGNPRPRIFRLVEDEALINRMGFNNLGAERMAAALRKNPPKGYILGVNIGKNKLTPQEEAGQDYLALLETFAPLAHYLAVNVSSPNTPGLRDLQAAAELEKLLSALDLRRTSLAWDLGRHVPIFVKLAPDLSEAALDEALDVIVSTGMDGVILTNTTLARDGLHSSHAAETGGLSGAPLRPVATERVAHAARRMDGRLPVIASGGVFTAADAQAHLDAGAALVQVYTGMIYEGPFIARDILRVGLHSGGEKRNHEGREEETIGKGTSQAYVAS